MHIDMNIANTEVAINYYLLIQLLLELIPVTYLYFPDYLFIDELHWFILYY